MLNRSRIDTCQHRGIEGALTLCSPDDASHLTRRQGPLRGDDRGRADHPQSVVDRHNDLNRGSGVE